MKHGDSKGTPFNGNEGNTEMSNEVTTTASAGALSMHAALAAYAQDQKINLTRFMHFNSVSGLLMTKDADRQDVIINEKTQFYLNLGLIAHGYVCWKSKAVVDRVMWLLTEKPNLPDASTLDDHGPYEGDRDGWTEQMSVPFWNPKDKMGYVFQASSLSSLNATKKMIGKVIMAAQATGRDVEKDVPLIEIFRDSYKNKKTGGTTYIPGFKVVGWESASELNLTVSGLPPAKDEEEKSEVASAGTTAEI